LHPLSVSCPGKQEDDDDEESCIRSSDRLALAQGGAAIDRDGDQAGRSSRREFNRQEVIHIARLSGVARVRNVDRRGRYWIVLGEPRRGRDLLNVRIDARTGRVVGMNRLRG
jgi:hypothetical protein